MKTVAKALALVIVVGALINLPRDIRFGSITVIGVLTVTYAAASWLLVLAFFVIPRSTLAARWLVLFLIWTVVGFVWNPPTPGGVQNVVAFAAFAGLLLLSATVSYCSPHLARYTGQSLTWAALFAVALFGSGVTASSPRSFGLFGLLGVAWFLAAWRTGSTGAFWGAFVITTVVGLSNSRMALFIALFLFPLSGWRWRSLREWLRVSLWVIFACLVSYLLITYVESINTHFFGGDKSLKVGEVAINTSGRIRGWTAVVESFYEAPWIGKGAGSANDALAAIGSNLEHPHNDYLRFMHDYGLVGLGLWVLGYGGLLWTTWGAWQNTPADRRAQARLHLAAFLGMTAIALAMVTDNVSIYSYVMAPLAVLAGTSLGSLSRSRALARSVVPPAGFVGMVNAVRKMKTAAAFGATAGGARGRVSQPHPR